MFPPLQAVEYETLAGLVIMPLTQNHIDLFRGILMQYRRKEKRMEPKLIISHIFPGSFVSTTGTLSEGMILESVNGTPVATLHDFRHAILGLKGTAILTLKGAENPSHENVGGSCEFTHYRLESIRETMFLGKKFGFTYILETSEFFQQLWGEVVEKFPETTPLFSTPDQSVIEKSLEEKPLNVQKHAVNDPKLHVHDRIHEKEKSESENCVLM
jgi:hypothetical protein